MGFSLLRLLLADTPIKIIRKDFVANFTPRPQKMIKDLRLKTLYCPYKESKNKPKIVATLSNLRVHALYGQVIFIKSELFDV